MKKFFGMSIAMIIFTLIANLLFWGGVIYLALWCLKHFGVI
jgi:hypothetical protein